MTRPLLFLSLLDQNEQLQFEIFLKGGKDIDCTQKRGASETAGA